MWHAARNELLQCLGLQVVAGIGVALQLFLGRSVIAVVVASHGHHGLGDVAAQLIGLAVVTTVLGFAASALTERQRILAELVERHVQGQIIAVVSGVELASLESPAFHDRLQRARVNAKDRSWEVAFAVITLLSGMTTLIALGSVLVSVAPVVLPAVLVAYLPLWWATTRNGQAFYDFAFDMTPADRERAYLQHVLTNKADAMEIRLFAIADFLRSRYDEIYARRIAELRRVARRRMGRSLLASGGSTIVTLLGVGLLVQLALAGNISPADAGVAAIAVQQLGVRVRGMAASSGSLHECSLFLDDLVGFLALREPSTARPEFEDPPPPFSAFRMENVSFRYPETTRTVLRDVSVEIGSGEVVAIVGRNGSGKTTLAKLLCALYKPSLGCVTWDGVELEQLDPTWIRRGVTAIFQDFARYELTAYDNIGLGDHDRMDEAEAIRAAASMAGIDAALAALPDGYDTRLSRSFEDGAELSIGQWQRVALARAFFRDAPFLVLDEPTAALDAEAEHALFESIRRLRRGRAVLLISHRFSSVRSADRIYVLDEGRVVEEGTHEHLIARGGTYAQMFALQASAYQDEQPISPLRGTRDDHAIEPASS